MLVAEDDPNLGTILKAYLTQKGYTVFLAVDGQSALDSYQNDDVDACILDIMMPVKDGFTVAKEIRRVDKRIPIIFLTAKNLEADKLKGFEIGADDYVTKPFSMDELLARLNATIRRSFDDGDTWSQSDEILVKNDAMNVMSVSFLRLDDGRIALFYIRKIDAKAAEILMRTSPDEAKTWSEAVNVTGGMPAGWYVLNNARVIQLKTGRILAPLAIHPRATWQAGAVAEVFDSSGERVVTQ